MLVVSGAKVSLDIVDICFVDFCEALENITKFEIKKFRSNIGKFRKSFILTLQ